ncbi:MAG: M20 family metallo-hydrolase [Spirochaetia bacterium]|nr:M20 family metallo-hydrolase [Spirochaetia bacterium]
MQIKIEADQLWNELDKLATYSDTPAPSVTRILFTENDVKARDYFKSLAREAGFDVREDSIGNIFVRFSGSEKNLPAVGTGSHCDAVPYAGRYDGTVGVFAGLEALRALKKSGFTPKRPLEVVFFTSEEPTRFGLGCIGSRLMSGAMDLNRLGQLRDKDGKSVDEARKSAGYDGDLNTVKLPSKYYDYFVELHIEQGPVLERESKQIGAVTAIAAPASFRIQITGEGGHAGGVLMPGRRDALVPCAILTQELERLARESSSPDSVGTVGVVKVHPGAINSIPANVTMEMDIRDTQLKTRDQIVEKILAKARELEKERNVKMEIETINSDPPAISNETIMTSIESSCQETSLSHMRLVSRAYHDSLFMARVAPMGMIFIPSRGGVSHRADEFSSKEEIARGAEILARTMAKLSVQA